MKNLLRTKASNFARHSHCCRRSLIEQSKRSGLKDVAESTAGIIPGDRGKVGDNWCRPPLQWRKSGARHLSPVPLTGVVSGQFTHELGTELQGAIRNRVEQSQACGKFRTACRRSHPRGFWLLLRRPERSRGSRRDDPAKRPSSPHEPGAQRNRDRGERADLGKVRQPPQLGRSRKAGSPRCKSEMQPER